MEALKLLLRYYDSLMTGNPVRFGDGCATVMSNELPDATGQSNGWEGGSKVCNSKSGYRLSCPRPNRLNRVVHFSVKEKRWGLPDSARADGNYRKEEFF